MSQKILIQLESTQVFLDLSKIIWLKLSKTSTLVHAHSPRIKPRWSHGLPEFTEPHLIILTLHVLELLGLIPQLEPPMVVTALAKMHYSKYRIIWHYWALSKVSHQQIVILTDSSSLSEAPFEDSKNSYRGRRLQWQQFQWQSIIVILLTIPNWPFM